MRQAGRKPAVITALIGLVPVIWLGLLAAPRWNEGLFGMLMGLSAALERPFQITWCGQTVRTELILCGIYLLSLGCFYASRHNTRYGQEHGSAKWADPAYVRRHLSGRAYRKNRLLTQNVSVSHNFFRHRRNLNVCVVGGSGSAKTRGYVMPNLMQANTSFVVTDPKGENLAGCGHLLEQEGCTVKVLDLIEMEKSCHYNPFHYLHSENDVQTMVTFLFTATTPKDARSQDPFWEEAAQMLLMAFAFYLYYEAPPQEQSFPMVMELLRACAAEDGGESVTDILFRRLEEKKPDHIAVRYYSHYRSAPEKTKDSIRMILSSHMAKFELTAVAELTGRDDLDLQSLGETKTALFCRIPDADKSYNFLIAMLYMQLMQQLFEAADSKHGGRLPVHVHFLMDEFANVAVPDDFEAYLSTMRSRNISASIILQNIAQLKTLFRDNKWESVLGNCDAFLYLGGNEQSTHEYVSKQLGKQTIWTRSNSLTRGSHGSTGRNDQTAGRELMTPSEVRELDNDSCILLIRGFRPILDRKFDLTKHPNYSRTKMGGGEAYRHGVGGNSVSARQALAEAGSRTEPVYIALTEREVEQTLRLSKSFT